MSFRNCIINAEAEGTITPEQAREARDLFDDLEEQYQGQMNRGAASSKAARDAFDALEREVAERKRRKLLQIQNWKEIKVNLDQYRNIKGEQDIGRAAEALFDSDGLSKYSSVVQREAAEPLIQHRAHARVGLGRQMGRHFEKDGPRQAAQIPRRNSAQESRAPPISVLFCLRISGHRLRAGRRRRAARRAFLLAPPRQHSPAFGELAT